MHAACESLCLLLNNNGDWVTHKWHPACDKVQLQQITILHFWGPHLTNSIKITGQTKTKYSSNERVRFKSLNCIPVLEIQYNTIFVY